MLLQFRPIYLDDLVMALGLPRRMTFHARPAARHPARGKLALTASPNLVRAVLGAIFGPDYPAKGDAMMIGRDGSFAPGA